MTGFLRPVLTLAFVFWAIFGVDLAQAGTSLRLELEGKIEDKIRAQVSPFDPYVQVQVKAKIRKLSIDLPGTRLRSSQMEISGNSLALSGDDIESIDVSVITRIDPVPAGLKTLLENSLGSLSARKRVHFEKMSADLSSLVRPDDNRVQEAITKSLEGTNLLLREVSSGIGWSWRFGLFALLLIASHSWTVWRSARTLALAVSKLGRDWVEGSENGYRGSSSGGAETRYSRDESLSFAKPAGNSGAPSESISPRLSDGLRSLSLDAHLALLSDCYWCEEDGYGALLWSEMTPDRRAEIISIWPTAKDYSAALLTEPHRGLRFHEHPYYLKPLHTSRVSQIDLLEQVKKNPVLYRGISPLRKSRLAVSMIDKIKWEAITTEFPDSLKFPASSFLRTLDQDWGAIEVTEADEEAILKDPSVVPVHLRSHIRSLLWLTLIDESERAKILGQLSAQQLAEVWIGPASLLERLESVIPEKKLQIAREYAITVPPSRSSPVMAHLVSEALSLQTERVYTVDSSSLSRVPMTSKRGSREGTGSKAA